MGVEWYESMVENEYTAVHPACEYTDDPICKLGWASHGLTHVSHHIPKGVGYVSKSYAYDPYRGRIY